MSFVKSVSCARIFWTLFCGALLLVTFGAGLTAAQSAPNYVGSNSCTSCHDSPMTDWQQSHHALAWTLPSPETVLGDFADVTFSHKDIDTRFYRDGDNYMIETQGPDGDTRRYSIAGVVGVEPLQQYLIETELGRLQSFDVAWDVDLKQWYHLYPTQDLPFDEAFHWSGPYKNWNARCAECHATGFEKNYTSQSKSYASAQAEIGVGCESCHGPAEAHLEWAKPEISFNHEEWNGVNAKGFTIDLTEGGETVVQQCAGCHSRREPFGNGNPLPGTDYHDAYRLSPLRAGLYQPDGQILDEVYVYGSFLQSKMNAKGVTCLNCHDPHTAELKAQDNSLCTQCHSEAGNPEFPSLLMAKYDDPSHTFHKEGSEGAQCKSCHMIERNYMGVDGRRDHSFRIPRPDLTLAIDTPNACNDCHDDNTAKWAADTVAEWFPNSTNRKRHFGQTFASARSNPTGEVLNLIEIAEYRELPPIVRATAINLLSNVADPAVAQRLEPLLEDESPLVRVEAIGVQRGAPETERSARLVGLFDDPVQAVRIAAARGFLGMRIAHMPERMELSMQKAMGEWQQSLLLKADFPETQLALGGLALSSRNMEAAVRAFEEAVSLDPQLTQAWGMIIRIQAATGDTEAAKSTVERALERIPNDPTFLQMRQELGG